MTHKSRSIFGEAYSARIDPARQSSNQQRSKVRDHRRGRGVRGVKPKTSLTTKSAGGGVQCRGEGVKERKRRARE